MLNFVKRFLGPPGTSADDRNGAEIVGSSSSSSMSSNRRKSFPVVEIVVPTRRSSSSASVGTPSSSRAGSPASDRSNTPQTSKKHGLTKSANSTRSTHKPVPQPKAPIRRVSQPEIPLSPPKRTRFNEEIQYQDFTPYKLSRGRNSLSSTSQAQFSTPSLVATLSPPRPALSKPSIASSLDRSLTLENVPLPLVHKIANSKYTALPSFTPSSVTKPKILAPKASSGPTRPAKRKRTSSDDGEQDISSDLEVAPLKIPRKSANQPSRSSTSTNGAQNIPKKVNGHVQAEASTSKSTAATFIDLSSDSSDDDDSGLRNRRSESIELPEILPVMSPKKLAMQKVDSKGKGRALEPAATIIGEKVLRIPIEAKFHSLEELADFPPDYRPPYALWVLARCAILGSGIDRVTLDGIISRISDKYLYYRYLAYESGSDERIKLGNALKNAMKSKLCFVITKAAGGPDWYSVLEDVNPALKRGPQTLKNDTVAASASNGHDSPISANGSTSKASYLAATSANTVKPALIPVIAAPLPPPRPTVPKITTISPGDLPRAQLDIFATSLLHLKNVPPPDEPLEAETGTSKVAPSKVSGVTAFSNKIQLDLHVPVRAAILGSPFRKLRLKALIEDIVWKYPQLAPKDDPDAQKKLSSAVSSTMSARQCFFRVQRWSNKKASFWMVDRSIDPRVRKQKSKWAAKAKTVAVNGTGDTSLTAPGLGMVMGVPPSSLDAPGATGLQAAAAFLTGEMVFLQRREFQKEVDDITKDLDDLHTFYQEREDKWNRRLAYLHESEVVVVTTEPDDSPADTPEAPEEASVTKSASPELEEFVPQRKTSSKANGTFKPTQTLPSVKTPHPLSKEVEIAAVPQVERLPSPSLSPSPPPAPPTYVCGYSDTRTGIICETRLTSREEREVHQRFAHGVKVTTSQHARFLAEAKLKVKKQMEQERANRKMSGKTGKKKLVSNGSELALAARKNITIKAIKAARNHGSKA